MTGHDEHKNLREEKSHEDAETGLPFEDHRRLLGTAIRELRARRGFSQETLGLESDIHRNYIGAMERGEINPSFRVFLKLTRGLDMPLSHVLRVYERNRDTAQGRAGLQRRVDRVQREEAEVLDQLQDDEPKPGSQLAWIGQQHAAVHLERLGLRIVERDFHTRWGTIDVIAHDDQRLVFCDVTARRFGTAAPLKTLSDPQRRHRARSAASVWLDGAPSKRPTVAELRFDAMDVTINQSGELVSLEHRVVAAESAAGARQ